MQGWTIRSLYRYISIYLYFILHRTFPFLSMSVFAASVQGRNAFLGTPLCWEGQEGQQGWGFSSAFCLVSNEETQHFAAQALKVHSWLVVTLEKRIGAAALPQTEGSSLPSLSGGGQSTANTFCVETGHLPFCCLGI